MSKLIFDSTDFELMWGMYIKIINYRNIKKKKNKCTKSFEKHM
jgi:hypothetical protein